MFHNDSCNWFPIFLLTNTHEHKQYLDGYCQGVFTDAWLKGLASEDRCRPTAKVQVLTNCNVNAHNTAAGLV